jgi:hypothetical protein
MRDIGSHREWLGSRCGLGIAASCATRPMRQADPAVPGVRRRGAPAQHPALRAARQDVVRVAMELHGKAASRPSAGARHVLIVPTRHAGRMRGRESIGAASRRT